MGRAFEKRKHKMAARYDKMAKMFTKIGKEIVIAVKAGGEDPGSNPSLRAAIQNAKGINMPKDRIEAAIKRATNKDTKDLEQVVYEGYGPHGVAVVVETATDNSTRTVANVRLAFNKNNGELGKTGSLSFLFDRKGLFKIKNAGQDAEELELELIDHGLESLETYEDEIWLYSAYEDFGTLQKGLEANEMETISSELVRVPTTTVELDEAKEEEALNLIERLEEDDDVQNVFHNLA